jgi:hypothetical protein
VKKSLNPDKSALFSQVAQVPTPKRMTQPTNWFPRICIELKEVGKNGYFFGYILIIDK